MRPQSMESAGLEPAKAFTLPACCAPDCATIPFYIAISPSSFVGEGSFTRSPCHPFTRSSLAGAQGIEPCLERFGVFRRPIWPYPRFSALHIKRPDLSFPDRAVLCLATRQHQPVSMSGIRPEKLFG